MSTKAELQVKQIGIVLSGVMFGLAAIFFFAFFFGSMGVQHDTLAQEQPGSYPFKESVENLKKVNFTVLTPKINTAYAETRPFISSDGKKLFFCRKNHPENSQREKDDQDIWVSSMQDDGQWGKAENLGQIVNTKGADAICSVSPDGSEVIMINEKMAADQLFMKYKKTDAGWTGPEYMAVENFYNDDSYIDAYYSYEANVLLMAIQRADSKGGQDLYVSFPSGKNKWSEPVNMGSLINSVKSDFAPFLAADGKTLYFVSYGHKGLGGCDIYQTTRLDESWKKWSTPKNLGEGINSSREESYFSISGDYTHIYFESYDSKAEVRDIFRADLLQGYKPQPALREEDELIVVKK